MSPPPNSRVDAAMDRAIELAEAGRLGAACRWMVRLVEEDPFAADRWVSLSVALLKLGLYTEAVACAETVSRMRPGWGVARYVVAEAMVSLGRYEKAVSSYRDAARLEGRNGQCLYRLGALYHRCQSVGAAEAVLTEASRLAPEDIAVDWELAQVRLKQEDVAGAVLSLRRAAERQPQYRWSHVQLAAIYKTIGRDADAQLWATAAQEGVRLAQQYNFRQNARRTLRRLVAQERVRRLLARKRLVENMNELLDFPC